MITREAVGSVYTHAGPEIGVASTKAFTSQLTALFVLALHLGWAIADWRGSFTMVFLLSAAVMSSGSLVALALPRDQRRTPSLP